MTVSLLFFLTFCHDKKLNFNSYFFLYLCSFQDFCFSVHHLYKGEQQQRLSQWKPIHQVNIKFVTVFSLFSLISKQNRGFFFDNLIFTARTLTFEITCFAYIHSHVGMISFNPSSFSVSLFMSGFLVFCSSLLQRILTSTSHSAEANTAGQ